MGTEEQKILAEAPVKEVFQEGFRLTFVRLMLIVDPECAPLYFVI